jgi:transcriptional regulator of acetoin/glycerol metabolism
MRSRDDQGQQPQRTRVLASWERTMTQPGEDTSNWKGFFDAAEQAQDEWQLRQR